MEINRFKIIPKLYFTNHKSSSQGIGLYNETNIFIIDFLDSKIDICYLINELPNHISQETFLEIYDEYMKPYKEYTNCLYFNIPEEITMYLKLQGIIK